MGACNEPKWALDACFKAEARRCGAARRIMRGALSGSAAARELSPRLRAQKQVKRRRNFEQAAAERERLAARVAARAHAASPPPPPPQPQR